MRPHGPCSLTVPIPLPPKSLSASRASPRSDPGVDVGVDAQNFPRMTPDRAPRTPSTSNRTVTTRPSPVLPSPFSGIVTLPPDTSDTAGPGDRRRSRTFACAASDDLRGGPASANSRGPAPRVSGVDDRCSPSIRPSASIARTSVRAAADVEVAVDLVLEAAGSRRGRTARRSSSCSTSPVSVEETTYLVVSLKNGAPGSSSDGPRRPRRLEHLVGRAAEQDAARAPVTAPMASPIFGSKP